MYPCAHTYYFKCTPVHTSYSSDKCAGDVQRSVNTLSTTDRVIPLGARPAQLIGCAVVYTLTLALLPVWEGGIVGVGKELACTHLQCILG